METAGHEQLIFNHDPETGLKAIIALHNTRQGPALGGCRQKPYESEEEAVLDVLQLSRAMTRKFVSVNLPFGGGKAVILDLGHEGRAAGFRSLGRMIATLNGRYGTGEDVGSTPEDMVSIREETDHVFGLPENLGGAGNPGPATAAGVLGSLSACLHEIFGSEDLRGRSIAVQGLGEVGFCLAVEARRRGAVVLGADLSSRRTAMAKAEGIEIVSPDRVHEAGCDIYSPCALSGGLSESTIPRIRARIIVGSANNQLKTPGDGEALARREILWVPDFIASSGAAIFLSTKIPNDRSGTLDLIEGIIRENTREVLRLAREQGISPSEAGIQLTDKRLKKSCKDRPIHVGTGSIDLPPLAPLRAEKTKEG